MSGRWLDKSPNVNIIVSGIAPGTARKGGEAALYEQDHNVAGSRKETTYYNVSDKNKRIRRTFRAAEGDWRRVDLHLHTPASADWLEPGVTYLQWLQKAESRGLDVVAITDHNTVEGIAQLRAEIERLTWMEANDRLRPQERRDLDEYRRLGEKVLVLPGFEFTATFGFHILAIFPPETPLRVLELILLRLNVPVDRLAEGSTEVGATSDVLSVYRLIDEAGGLVIAAHANSAHGVAMRGLGFGGQTKIAYTQDPHLHAMEVTDLEAPGRRSSAKFFDGTKPEYPRRMHCIQGSDAHRLTRDPKDKNRMGIGDRVTEVLLPEVSFDALETALKGDDFSVTRPYRPPTEEPFDYVKTAREQGETIIQSFHESMTVEGGRMNKLLADVVAFANTQGGTIYVGVSAQKKGTPRGVDDAPASTALLKREMERAITPSVACKVDVMQSEGVSVVRVSVPNGAEKPYALRQTRIYIRQEGETSEAARDEIVRLVLGARGTEAIAGEQAPGAALDLVPSTSPVLREPAQPVGSLVKAAPQVPAESKPAVRSPRRRRRRPSAAPGVPVTPATIADLEPSAIELAEPAEVDVQLVLDEARASARAELASVEVTAVEAPAATQDALALEAPVPEEATPIEAEKPKRRPRSRTTKSKATTPEVVEPVVVVEMPADAAAAAPQVPAVEIGPVVMAAEEEAPRPEIVAEPVELPDILEAPAVGVEIVSIEEREGTLYFTVRDLRNCNTVHNITSASARKLWSYAINQSGKRPVDAEKVTWRGDYGLWQVGRRAKKLRYDLVKRQPDGHLRVFYGVTADGMDGPWAQFLKDEDKAE